MPYSDQWGYPPYDPSLPGGGWDAETWMRYRKQQRDRSYPGQFPSMTERKERNAKRAGYNRSDAIAKIDATLARNTLGPRPPDLPDGGNAASRGRRSGAQILYDRKVERRALLQAKRDRLAALSGQAGGTPSTLGTPTTPNVGATGSATTPTATTGQNAYVNAATGIPIAKATAATTASAGAIARAKQPIAYSGPQPPTAKAVTPAEQAAITGQVGRIATTGTTTRAKLPAAGRSDWATEQRKKGTSAYVIQQQKGQVAAQAKKVAGYTPAAGKSKDEPAPSKSTTARRTTKAQTGYTPVPGKGKDEAAPSKKKLPKADLKKLPPTKVPSRNYA